MPFTARRKLLPGLKTPKETKTPNLLIINAIWCWAPRLLKLWPIPQLLYNELKTYFPVEVVDFPNICKGCQKISLLLTNVISKILNVWTIKDLLDCWISPKIVWGRSKVISFLTNWRKAKCLSQSTHLKLSCLRKVLEKLRLKKLRTQLKWTKFRLKLTCWIKSLVESLTKMIWPQNSWKKWSQSSGRQISVTSLKITSPMQKAKLTFCKKPCLTLKS